MSKIKFLLLIIVCFFLVRCVDDSLTQLPEVNVERPNQEVPFRFTDSVNIDDGMLYRKLIEKGYEDVYGLAKFAFPNEAVTPSYDLLLISCSKEDKAWRFLVTVDRRFQSIQDITGIDPTQHEILQLYPVAESTGMTVDLVTRSSYAQDRYEMTRIEINEKGIMDSNGSGLDVPLEIF